MTVNDILNGYLHLHPVYKFRIHVVYCQLPLGLALSLSLTVISDYSLYRDIPLLYRITYLLFDDLIHQDSRILIRRLGSFDMFDQGFAVSLKS